VAEAGSITSGETRRIEATLAPDISTVKKCSVVPSTDRFGRKNKNIPSIVSLLTRALDKSGLVLSIRLRNTMGS